MKDFRMGIVWADNNSRKMQGKPMLRIRHYNKAWWRRVGGEYKRLNIDYCAGDFKTLDDIRAILNRNKVEE